jgi:uncharacterized protein
LRQFLLVQSELAAESEVIPRIALSFFKTKRFLKLERNVVLVEMELSRIIISEINDQQVVYLKEKDGDRSFPILIGIFEATSINRRLTSSTPPRPLTHDLLKNSLERLGGKLQDVVVTRMVEHTYYAVLRVEVDGEVIEIDSRPSDAIALAVHYEPTRPIFVADEVLSAVT